MSLTAIRTQKLFRFALRKTFLDISTTLAAMTLKRKTKKIQLKCKNFNENIHSQRLDLQSVVHDDIAHKLNKSEA